MDFLIDVISEVYIVAQCLFVQVVLQHDPGVLNCSSWAVSERVRNNMKRGMCLLWTLPVLILAWTMPTTVPRRTSSDTVK